MSPTMLALQARRRLKIRVNLANMNIVQAGRMYGRQSLPNIYCKEVTGIYPRALGSIKSPRASSCPSLLSHPWDFIFDGKLDGQGVPY
jgi:hypothetical protein